MWLEGIRLQQIDTALEGDRPTNIDQVLADILKGARVQQTVPTACPSCRRDLVRHPLPVDGLFAVPTGTARGWTRLSRMGSSASWRPTPRWRRGAVISFAC
jgi:hypothetical protein